MKKQIKPICIIPARGGSKRIKNKNIINFLGKPLIYYSIKAARDAKIFSRIIVTTDSLKIKKIALKYGAEVPFIRENRLSNNLASAKDAFVDAILKINSQNIKFHCLLYPTAPLIKSSDLIKAYRKIKEEKSDGLMTIAKCLNHPLRSLVIKGKNLQFKWKRYQKKNSQDLPEFFFDCGNFYFFKTEKIIKSKSFYPKKIIPYVLKIYNAVDIDNYDDLELAKKLYGN